ncbi:carboxyl transferase domain-containing protein [Lacticaseibacillus saniviri]
MTRAYEVVQAAREERPYTTQELIDGLVTDFQSFHGDRNHSDDPAMIGGIGWLDDTPVTIIATDKGATLKTRLATHFGSPEPWGYRKAERLMKQAAKFNRPIITLINTPGAYPGQEAEANGQGEAIASLLLTASLLPVPIVSVLVGEGGSGGALALALGDQVWMTDKSMYAILSPEGFASILWKDSKRAQEAAEVMQLTPDALFEATVVDHIVPDTGIDFAADLRARLVPTIAELQAQSTTERLEARYARFRRF